MIKVGDIILYQDPDNRIHLRGKYIVINVRYDMIPHVMRVIWIGSDKKLKTAVMVLPSEGSYKVIGYINLVELFDNLMEIYSNEQ